MATATYDAVIIGAGILGASSAYYLSEMGITNVAIIDSHAAGGVATRATAAMVMHQTGVKETTKLSKLSIQKYARFREEIGYDIGFKRTGSALFTTTEAGKQILEVQAVMQRAGGVPTDIWNGNRLQEATHNLIGSQAIMMAIYCPADGYIDAGLATQGYLQRAKSKGAEVITDTQIAQIIIQNGQIRAVETTNGERISTNIVINCAGMYAGDVARTIGINVPIKASYKCLGILTIDSELADFPILEDIDQGWYLRPHQQGVLVGFGHGEWVEDDERQATPTFDANKEEVFRTYAAQRAPRLAQLPLTEKWAGYRPMISPDFGDNLPIIGGVESVKGYYNNCGYGEFGISHAAIGGELLASIISGRKTLIDTTPFLLSRFAHTSNTH